MVAALKDMRQEEVLVVAKAAQMLYEATMILRYGNVPVAWNERDRKYRLQWLGKVRRIAEVAK